MDNTAPLIISDEGFTVLSEPENATADIVLIHGLQGNPYATWAHTKAAEAPQIKQRRTRLKLRLFRRFGDETTPKQDATAHEASTSATIQDTVNVYWPKDCLAEEEWCKSARILTYGYDTAITRGYAAANKSDLFAHAKDLLYNIQREKPSGRPIIFVAHCLGGVLLKETLRRSEASEEDNFKDIVRSTKGIIFLGTPHRGNYELASLADTIRRVTSIVARVDSNHAILRSLGIDSPELGLGRESFLVLWRRYNFQVKTFQEAHGLSGINIGPANEKVVPDASSSLDDPREHAETISANHMDMTKFRGASDPSYRKVSSAIRTMLNFCTQGFLKSLYFPEIYDRQNNIRTALSQTVDWLFTTLDYTAWIDGTDVAKYHGLLSLLLQILEQDPNALSHLSKEFESKTKFQRDEITGDIQGDVKWYQEELQDYLGKALKTPESKPVIIFVDAMDECDDEVRDLVNYFNRLTKEALQLGAKLKVCLSSRHYPQISFDGCSEIIVEHHNTHDILRFIETEAENHSSIQSLKQDIADRSGGVFLWVILVVSILKASGRGKSLKWLKNKLDEIPRELKILFQRTINLMQLILFAQRPLHLTELHTALSFSLHAYPSIAAWKDSAEYLDTGKAQHEMIIELSKGLLEPEFRWSSDYSSYQFIHETAREFFLSGEGFKLLKLCTDSVVGSGHETVALACARYPNIEEFIGYDSSDLITELTVSLERQDPKNARYLSLFHQYASRFLIPHTEIAVWSEDFGESVLRYLNAQDTISWPHRLGYHTTSAHADLMYAATEIGSHPIVMKLHRMGFDINSRCDAPHNYPLLVAIHKFGADEFHLLVK
ncbi:hypothetical protein GGR58DRAFT_510267 [Xylaria digitata]|nr:hypothetical protein GGR58DRAFT_510267 [Xylaria digitata]